MATPSNYTVRKSEDTIRAAVLAVSVKIRTVSFSKNGDAYLDCSDALTEQEQMDVKAAVAADGLKIEVS